MRLWSSGFESNSLTADVEITNSFSVNATIQNVVVRSGAYALKVNNTGHNDRISPFYRFRSGAGNGPFFFRKYINIATLPAVTVGIMGLNNNADDTTSSHQAVIKMTSTGTLQLFYNSAGTLTQIGSDSSALSTNQWYCIELWFDRSPAGGSQIVKARIDQAAEFASATNLTINLGVQTFVFGTNILADVTDNASIFYIDDLAINDSTTSFNTSYPGVGSITHLKPVAAGDATQWTPDSGLNYFRVAEITPDNATSYVQDSTVSNADMYNLENFITVHRSINLVQIGARFANDTADATTAFKLQCEKISNGTISQSSAIIANSTTFKTNATAQPTNYPLNLPQDPDNINWTQDTINSMQIGVITTAVGTNKNRLSTIWALVEYIPGAETNRFGNQFRYIRVGDGMGRSEGAT